uniref:Orf120a protein n=1 Tax=Solanum tuberosum TaxID=4113 RepID=M1ACM7_SOLTU
MDVTRPLPKMIKIRDPKGRVLEQQIWYEWKPLYYQKCLQVGHSCDKPKEIPAKRGQGQGHKREWRPTTMGDKNQEKQTKQQSDPIHEVDTQRVKENSQEQENWQIVSYKSVGKRVALQTTWIENPEQDERSRFESGQHSGASEEAIIEPKPPNNLC